jgi:periplasmic divalent cation tolerance protein
MADTEYIVVLCTVSDTQTGGREAAVALARALVEEHLAACVQVIPGGTAIYRWQGQLYTEPQAQLLIKTRADAWPCLRGRIVALHGDEVPEILALPVVDGHAPYLAWIDEMVTAECIQS